MRRHLIEVGARRLSVYEAGATDGPTILHHHGTPSSGEPFGPWAADAQARGVRLIGYDRPGYGESTPHPERTVADAAPDSAAIMDALGVERFVTWGISGGGPHALACAALLGERVAAVASLAGVAPFTAPGLNYFAGMGNDNLVEFGLAMAGREHVEPYCAAVAEQMAGSTGPQLVEAMSTLVSAVDAAVLEGDLGEHLASGMRTAFAQGPGGWVDDDLAFVSAFGFDPARIAVPALIVHGREDRFVPRAHGEWLARAIAGAEPWMSEGDGHLTLIARRVGEVHGWLLSRL